MVVAVGFLVKTYASPDYRPNQAKALSFTENCVRESDDLREDEETSERARYRFGIPAIAFSHEDILVSVFFAASQADAQQVEQALRQEFAEVDAGELDPDLAHAADEGRVTRSGSVVLGYRDLPPRESRLALSRCVYSYETARFMDWFGMELASVGRPFLAGAEQAAKAPPKNDIEDDLETLGDLAARIGQLNGQIATVINDAVEIEDSDEARANVLGEIPPLLAAARAEAPRALESLRRARPTTEAGKELRLVYIDTLERQRDFAAKLEGGLRNLGERSVWGPLVDYADATEAERERLGAVLEEVLSDVPPDEREQLREVFAGSAG